MKKTSAVTTLLLIVLSACGRVQKIDSVLDSETASTGSTSLLRVECLSTTDNSRGLEFRNRLTLIVQDNNVSLKKRETLIKAEQTSSITTEISGRVNTVFDGTVVKKTHATVLLASTLITKTDVNGKKTENKPRYVLIEYSQGKIKVSDPDTKLVLSHGNCRTSEATGTVVTR